MIPTAAMLGGIVIGFLTVVGDLLNVAGSSTGIMLSISILYGYYEKLDLRKRLLKISELIWMRCLYTKFL